MDERELPTNKIHDYVTWPTTTQIFEDGRGGLSFPGKNNSNCRIEDGHLVSDDGKPVSVTVKSDVSYNIQDDGSGHPYETPVDIENIVYIPSYSVIISTDELNFKVEKFTHDNGHGEITLSDEIPSSLVAYLREHAVLRANTPDTLACTTLVTADIVLDWNNMVGKTVPYITEDRHIAIGNTSLPFDWDGAVTFDLFTELRISIGEEIYIYLQHQADDAANGVYCYSAGNVRKVAYAPVDSARDTEALSALHDTSVNDNVECCQHYRKAYSHREVYDEVQKNVGAVTGFGVKSMSISDCDGGLINWFTSNGAVDIGNGHSSVYVNGFGLGNMYRASMGAVQSDMKISKDAYDENDLTTLHPWMTWAYGTRYDAHTSNSVVALPRDWPFTNLTATENTPIFNRLTDTNNITLVKKGNCGDDTSVGNLERDVDGVHVYNNRHHIVLYPDYRQITGKDGYKDGSVVVKPLFVHIPASLDNKDGETVDITLSIQNVDPSAFGSSTNPKAALSGYYAAMAQPRVYVMGGVQLFSNKKIVINTITCNESGFTITSSNAAYKNDGVSLLGAETEVRANIVAMDGNATGNRKSFMAHGRIISNSNAGSEIEFVGQFPFREYCPYDIDSPSGRRKKFTICGMAYLLLGDNPTNTAMGLVSRDARLHRSDAGTGIDESDLDYYNKFYSIDSSDDHMVNLPKIDKRYLLATVYQTATSTFPWALANRRKLATISQSWTDEFTRDKSNKSLLHLIYEANKSLYQTAVNAIDNLPSISISQNPISYLVSAPWTSIASVLRIDLPSKYDYVPNRSLYGNPVRVANKVVGMLASDFKKMRMLSYVTGKKPRTKISEISISDSTSWPSPGDTLSTSVANPNSGTAAWQQQLVQSAWCSKLRNLPTYITYDTDSSAYPIFAESDDDGWFSYVNRTVDVYKCNDMDSSNAVETLPYGIEDGCTIYSDTSIIQAISPKIDGLPEHQQILKDLKRYAETVTAVRLDESVYMNLSNLGGTTTYTYGAFTSEMPLHADTEWMNPFTNIQSIDTVPYPDVANIDWTEFSESQQVFASADAVQMYRYEYETDDSTFHDSTDTFASISSVMPTETDLAKFLESYVTAYASKMPLHQYQGSRILLENGKFPDTDTDEYPIYLRAISRVKQRMSNVDADIVAHYINDCFAKTSASTRDPNVDRVNVDAASIGMSAPPYVNPANYKNQTYTRVYMQFTFSQKAGRWYTTDYRQYPTNYLSPLYGADAIGATLPSVWTEAGTLAITKDEHGPYANNLRRNIWRNPLCDNSFSSYRNHMYAPYSVVPPMDITLGCVPYLAGEGCVFDFENNGALKPQYNYHDDADTLAPLSRLETPYKPVSNGGLGLYPPADVNGGYSEYTDDGIHANFWSVRKFIRPAVSVLAGTDVPGHDEYPRSGDPVPSRQGGVISDATLYRMFDFPTAGVTEYKLPNTTDPDEDMAKTYLLYHRDGDDGILLNNVCALSYGVNENEQIIERE